MFFCIPFRRLNGQKVDYFHQSFISWICSISMCRDFFMSESIFQNISAHNQRYWSTIDSNSWYASKSPLECTYWLITIQCLTNKLVHIWAGIVTTNKKVIERFPLKPFREWWIVRNVVRWKKTVSYLSISIFGCIKVPFSSSHPLQRYFLFAPKSSRSAKYNWNSNMNPTMNNDILKCTI